MSSLDLRSKPNESNPASARRGTALTTAGYPPLPAGRRSPSTTNRPASPIPPIVAATVGLAGRAMVTAGLLLLLFAGFQLWGTGLNEARAQEELSGSFERRLATATPKSPEITPIPEMEPAPAAEQPEDQPDAAGLLSIVERRDPGRAEIVPASISTGDAVAVVEIPAIGVSKTIVEGTTRDALRSGPGHYSSTPLPGRPGNAAIAGHRTTHGAPFFDIDLLQPGDEIQVETLDGRFTYVVNGHDDGAGGQIGHIIVDPDEVGVIADQGDNRLTLTACHPKYSAKQRIIVSATLQEPPTTDGQPTDPALGSAPDTVGDDRQTSLLGPPEDASVVVASASHSSTSPVPTTPDPTSPADAGQELWQPPAAPAQEFGPGSNDAITESLGWQPIYLGPTLAWAAFTTLVAAIGWVLGRLWRRWPAYAMAVPPFGLALFYCFANLEQLIPAV